MPQKSQSKHWSFWFRFLSLVLVAAAARAGGAPCCGSTAAVPALLNGDDRFQISSALSLGRGIADADTAGDIERRASNDVENLYAFRLDVASLLTDRLQAGVSLPYVYRDRKQDDVAASASGLGDVAVNLGYEFLTDWSYSAWRPRGHAFVQLRVPTGASAIDESSLFSVHVRGRGYYSVGAGVLLTKSWGDWDVALVGELHRAFPRTKRFEFVPGWGGSLTVNAGVSPWTGPVRLGVTLGSRFEEGVATHGDSEHQAPGQDAIATGAQLSYLFNEEWSASLILTDESLIPVAMNTSLYRTVGFLFQRRWPR